MKRYSTLCFMWKNKVWKLENLESFWQRKRRRRSSKRFSKVVWKSYWNASQGLAFIDSSCLVKKIIGRVITLRKTWKPLEELHLLTFYSKLVTSNRLPKPCNWLHKAFYEKMWLFTTEFEFQCSDTLVIDYQYIVIDYTI